MKLRRRRSTRALVLASLALICTIIGTNAIFLYNLRESSLQTTEANLARYSLALAEQADRSFASLDLVLSSVGDYLGRKGVTDVASYQRIMSAQETHLLLKEKITGLPQVDAVTMIDPEPRSSIPGSTARESSHAALTFTSKTRSQSSSSASIAEA